MPDTPTMQTVVEALRARRPAMYAEGPAGPVTGDSLGAQLVASESYRSWVERFPQGGPSSSITAQADPTEVRLRIGGPDTRMRALVTSQDAVAGSWVAPDRGPLEEGIFRPLTIRQLVSVIPTSSDQVDFPREVSRVAGAAPVAEATAATGTSGTKPEGGLVFELVQVGIKTIAVWVPATKRIMADATGLRAYVDQYLEQDVGEELEDQILTGNGTGENFTGILNTAGIGAAGLPGTGESALDQVRKAKRLVQVDGRVNPTAVVLNPTDAQKIDLLKVNAEVNHFVRDPFLAAQLVIYGMIVVETTAMPAGTGLVGDFRKAILFDREEATVTIGTVGDDFIRNIVRVLAELRAGFTVARPKAFATLSIP